MFVLFRYDPEASTHKKPAERAAADLAVRAELGRIGAFLSRVSAYRSTRAAAATLAAIAFGVLEDATHEVVIGLQLHPALKAMADGAIVAACGGAMVWLILTAVSRRRSHVALQQQTVARLHGDVREALSAIVDATRAMPHEREKVLDNVERVEAAMKQLNGERVATGKRRPGRDEFTLATSTH